MRNQKTPPLQGLFLFILLPWALLTLPNPAWAHHEQVAQASGSLETAEAPKAEGSKSKGPGHGSPQGMMGGPHGKSEGSGSKKRLQQGLWSRLETRLRQKRRQPRQTRLR